MNICTSGTFLNEVILFYFILFHSILFYFSSKCVILYPGSHFRSDRSDCVDKRTLQFGAMQIMLDCKHFYQRSFNAWKNEFLKGKISLQCLFLAGHGLPVDLRWVMWTKTNIKSVSLKSDRTHWINKDIYGCSLGFFFLNVWPIPPSNQHLVPPPLNQACVVCLDRTWSPATLW